eukprot:10713307-Lingulodinium_polyedra.AAC.1
MALRGADPGAGGPRLAARAATRLTGGLHARLPPLEHRRQPLLHLQLRKREVEVAGAPGPMRPRWRHH